MRAELFRTEGDLPLMDVMAFTKELGTRRSISLGFDGKPQALYVEMDNGTCVGMYPGDYIVRDDGGGFHVVPANDFPKLLEAELGQ